MLFRLGLNSLEFLGTFVKKRCGLYFCLKSQQELFFDKKITK